MQHSVEADTLVRRLQDDFTRINESTTSLGDHRSCRWLHQ
jgi:hypothetical protein